MSSKKHQAWARALSKYWQERGTIDFCEFRFEGCFGTYGLHPAHSLKRRKIRTREEFFEVGAACGYCGSYLDEKLGPEEMYNAVREVIARREC